MSNKGEINRREPAIEKGQKEIELQEQPTSRKVRPARRGNGKGDKILSNGPTRERLMMLMMLNNKDAASGDRHKVHYMTLELARFEREISCQERHTERREKTDMARKSPRREEHLPLARASSPIDTCLAPTIGRASIEPFE